MINAVVAILDLMVEFITGFFIVFNSVFSDSSGLLGAYIYRQLLWNIILIKLVINH